MKIEGLSEYLKTVKLAHFIWCGTGEGYTRNAKIVYDGYPTDIYTQAIDIGFGKDVRPQIIDSVIEKTEYGQTYLDWNPQFKTYFYECFGSSVWEQFRYVVCEQKSILQLESKLHFNLS
jgi:hypothetical protein